VLSGAGAGAHSDAVTAFPDGPVVQLPQGDVTEGVVRIGDTVRRPHQPSSEFVAAFLEQLGSAGFDGAPRYLGRDRQGRDVLTFLDGEVPGDPVPPWAAADGVLPSVGALVRRLHDAAEGWVPPVPVPQVPERPSAPLPAAAAQLISHRDVTPQNVVFRDGAAWGLVDFDLAGVTTRSIDLANTAMHWVPLVDPADRNSVYDGSDVASRIALLLNGYRAAGSNSADDVSVQAFLDACTLRFAGLYRTMRWNAENLGGGWARMWAEGVGDVIRRREQWFSSTHADLLARLRAKTG
jgi:Ser/Thr protein kinase RdoA (MazF antagonist)